MNDREGRDRGDTDGLLRVQLVTEGSVSDTNRAESSWGPSGELTAAHVRASMVDGANDYEINRYMTYCKTGPSPKRLLTACVLLPSNHPSCLTKPGIHKLHAQSSACSTAMR